MRASWNLVCDPLVHVLAVGAVLVLGAMAARGPHPPPDDTPLQRDRRCGLYHMPGQVGCLPPGTPPGFVLRRG